MLQSVLPHMPQQHEDVARPSALLDELYWQARIHQYYLGHMVDLWSLNFDTRSVIIAPDFQEIDRLKAERVLE